MCTLLDAHVHYHDIFDVSAFLSSAAQNFSHATQRFGDVSACVLAVCATDENEPPLSLLADRVLGTDWSVTASDPRVLVVSRAPEGNPAANASRCNQLVLIAGRQVVTRERLELLAIGTASSLRHGLPLQETMQQVEELNGVSVLPWGFGKWLFERGSVVRSLVSSAASSSSSGTQRSQVLLGDNGCRWQSLRPRLLKFAEAASFSVIAGSDPLPLASHVSRAGSFGSVLDVNIDATGQNVADSICQTLRELRTSPPTFGRCRSAFSLLRDQVTLRLAKR